MTRTLISSCVIFSLIVLPNMSRTSFVITIIYFPYPGLKCVKNVPLNPIYTLGPVFLNRFHEAIMPR